MDSENRSFVLKLVFLLFILAVVNAGSCAYNDAVARSACIEKGGIPTAIRESFWLCLLPLQTVPVK